jgi:hypothetical protein
LVVDCFWLVVDGGGLVVVGFLFVRMVLGGCGKFMLVVDGFGLVEDGLVLVV